MSFACCVGYDSFDRLDLLAKHGYTSYETGLAALKDVPEESIIALVEHTKKLGMNCVSHNVMFPSNIKLLNGAEDYSKIREYLDFIFDKAKIIGSPTIVLGSGGARRIPEDMSVELATERFTALLSDVIAPMAKKYGITIALEELRREECNFINTCREAMEIIRAVNKPEIKLLVDYYHAMLGGDKLDEIASYGSYIKHVHIASPKNSRLFPIKSELSDCRDFFAALKTAGYDGAISLEGGDGGNFEAAIVEAISVMKEAMPA